MHNLRCLETHWGILARSHAALSQAQQLDTCRVLGPPDAEATPLEEWLNFWAWAAAHPPLRHLRFVEDREGGLHTAGQVYSLLDATLALLQQRPMLSVVRNTVRRFDEHPFTNDPGDAEDWAAHQV